MFSDKIMSLLSAILRGPRIRNHFTSISLYQLLLVVKPISLMFKTNKNKTRKQYFHLRFLSASVSATSYMMLGKPASLGISFSFVKQLLKDPTRLWNATFYSSCPLPLGACPRGLHKNGVTAPSDFHGLHLNFYLKLTCIPFPKFLYWFLCLLTMGFVLFMALPHLSDQECLCVPLALTQISPHVIPLSLFSWCGLSR